MPFSTQFGNDVKALHVALCDRVLSCVAVLREGDQGLALQEEVIPVHQGQPGFRQRELTDVRGRCADDEAVEISALVASFSPQFAIFDICSARHVIGDDCY
jgi:hypothetical protein